MNVWKFTAPGKIQKLEDKSFAAKAPAAENKASAAENKIPPAESKAPAAEHKDPTESELLRVRITKVFMSGVDAALYHGSLKVKYPIVPGRFAVGFIADENQNPLFPKGTRVLLHTFRARPYTGTEKIDFSEDEYAVCGQTQDGFLRDFALVAPADMTPIPDVLNDERALIAHYVALGRSAIERLNVKKGQHIAVIGANVMGILICQLLIYQQVSPILIDADPARLGFARTCGIYYTLPADDSLLDGVANITGGRLASGAIFVIGAPGNNHKAPFRVSAPKTNTVYCGFVPDNAAFSLDEALKKQLSIHFVQKVTELERALNLIITHAVDTEGFSARFIRPAEVGKFFDTYGDHPEHDVSEVNIVSLI